MQTKAEERQALARKQKTSKILDNVFTVIMIAAPVTVIITFPFANPEKATIGKNMIVMLLIVLISGTLSRVFRGMASGAKRDLRDHDWEERRHSHGEIVSEMLIDSYGNCELRVKGLNRAGEEIYDTILVSPETFMTAIIGEAFNPK